MSDSFGREVSSRISLSQRVKTYVDVSLSFNPSPVTNDITLLTNERAINNSIRSEERRVGKECRSRWSRDH